jgi:hypothetical protein
MYIARPFIFSKVPLAACELALVRLCSGSIDLDFMSDFYYLVILSILTNGP